MIFPWKVRNFLVYFSSHFNGFILFNLFRWVISFSQPFCLIFDQINSRQTNIYRPVIQPRDQIPTPSSSSSSTCIISFRICTIHPDYTGQLRDWDSLYIYLQNLTTYRQENITGFASPRCPLAKCRSWSSLSLSDLNLHNECMFK